MVQCFHFIHIFDELFSAFCKNLNPTMEIFLDLYILITGIIPLNYYRFL